MSVPDIGYSCFCPCMYLFLYAKSLIKKNEKIKKLKPAYLLLGLLTASVSLRFLKQELNFSHLMSTNINGIKVILYMTLILSMLVQIYKKYSQVGFKTAKRRVKMELDDLLTILIVRACGGNPDIIFPSP